MGDIFHDGLPSDFVTEHQLPKHATPAQRAAHLQYAKAFMRQPSGRKAQYAVHVVSILYIRVIFLPLCRTLFTAVIDCVMYIIVN